MERRPFFSLVWCACTAIGLACNGQSPVFTYRALPAAYGGNSGARSFMAKAAPALPADAFRLETALPQGYVKDGSVDYTRSIQDALDKHRVVVFPGFPLLVNEDGLTIKSNSKLYFSAGSRLLMQPTGKGAYQVLRLYQVQDVELNGPVIEGDRKEHKGTAGEWGMGIAIRSSSNIRINDPVVNNCWGDGIYIARLGNGPVPQNITIRNARLDYNRRNGISIIAVDGLKLIRPVVYNTYGTLPMGGIDIEPNNPADRVDNIEMDRPVTFNNGRYGLVIGLHMLPGNVRKNVRIRINNHIDDSSPTALWMGGFKTSYNGAVPLGGNIDIIDPVWKNNTKPFRKGNAYDYAPSIRLQNVSIQQQQQGDAVQRLKKELGTMKNIKVE